MEGVSERLLPSGLPWALEMEWVSEHLLPRGLFWALEMEWELTGNPHPQAACFQAHK